MKVRNYLYKSTKVVYDAHLEEYQVYYKNWFFWKFDSCYKFDDTKDRQSGRHVHYCTREEAEERAITRAQAMLETVEVWKQSNFIYY